MSAAAFTNGSSSEPLIMSCLTEREYNAAAVWLSKVSNVYGENYLLISSSVCISGLLANGIFMAVLRRPALRKNRINKLLVTIACLDSILMLLMVLFLSLTYLVDVYGTFAYAVYTVAFLGIAPILHTTSLWLRVLMGAIRYLVVCKRTSSALTLFRRLPIVVLVLFITVTLLSTPNLLKNQILQIATNESQQHWYRIDRPEWWDCSWERRNFFIAGLFFKLLPCVLMVPLVGSLVAMVVETAHRKERLRRTSTSVLASEQSLLRRVLRFHGRTTLVLLVLILVIFLLTELPQGLIRLAIAVRPSTFLVYQIHLGSMLDMMALLHCNTNFVLYCAMNSQFRGHFRSALQTIGRASFRSYGSTRENRLPRAQLYLTKWAPNLTDASQPTPSPLLSFRGFDHTTSLSPRDDTKSQIITPVDEQRKFMVSAV